MLTHNENEAEGELICKSRNFTMVYSEARHQEGGADICDSRNFTMVYTLRDLDKYY